MLLPIGRYFGSSVRQRGVNGLTLTLSRYASGDAQPWHTHENPTLFLVMQGGLRERFRRSETDLGAMSLVYHPTDREHRSEAGAGGLFGLNIEPSASWLTAHWLRPDDLGSDAVLPSPLARSRALRLALRAFLEPDALAGEIEADAFEVMAPLISSPKSREPHPPRWLRRVEAFLNDERSTQISLRDAANEADVHPVHLARVFRAHHGCSVGDYLRTRRLLRAAESVLQGGSGLAEAAHGSGFADQAHFTRQFGREFGLSPRTLLSFPSPD